MTNEVEVEQQALATLEQAKGVLVSNDASYEAAGRFLVEIIKPMVAEIDKTFDPIIKAAHLAHKEAVGQKKRIMEPIDRANTHLRGQLSTYQEQKRKEARIEQERLRREVEQREQAERMERALELERLGKREEAEAALEEPALPPMVPEVQVSVPEVAGLSGRDVWKFRIVDKSKIKPEFLSVDEVKIGQIVRSMKQGAAGIVGGIEVYSERVASVR